MKTTLRVSLNAAQFPFLYRDANRSVILPGLDANIRSTGYYANPANADWGIPSLLYCENVMPIAKGLISSYFSPTINAYGVSESRFDQGIILRDASENNTLLVPANGLNFILSASTGLWTSVLPFTFSNKLITRAYVQGRTFICYEKQKLFEYDGINNTLIDRTSALVLPAGYTIADIRGIGGASNYLILFTDIQVFWSDPTNPLNFDRTLNNGSGYQIPQDVRGRITAILPVSGGAIIYTVRNAVAITFTNNAALPFVFRGISNSGGVASYEQVAYDADEKYQYVWGSGGFQQVSLQIAQSVFPEISDFITSNLYETYNPTTHTVSSDQLGSYLSVKLTYVSQRFLVISYGPSSGAYTYALIYDTALERWGKVKVNHTDSFTYPYPNLVGDLTYAQLNTDYAGLGASSYTDLGVGVITTSPPKKSIAFLGADGNISILAVDYTMRASGGVAIIGHIQHNRNRMTTLHQVELEGLDDSHVAPRLFDIVSVNGKTVDRVVEYLAYEIDPGYRNYLGDQVGKNHVLVLEGVFNLTGCLVQLANHGRSQ